MYTLSNYTSTWQNGCRQGGFLLVGLLLVLTLLRVFFLGYFGDFATMDLSEAFAALWMGFRVDLKWSLLLLLPAWILWVLGFFFSFFRDFAKLFVIVAVLLMSVFWRREYRVLRFLPHADFKHHLWSLARRHARHYGDDLV